MESTTRQEKEGEWYDEVYFDSDQDSDQEEESPGIGLMGTQQKKKPSKEHFVFAKSMKTDHFFLS
jgi:hypothetical protein